jgi:hypothetical protein
MKTLLFWLFCLSAGFLHAATSDILIPTGGIHYRSSETNGAFPGFPGNVVFDGQRFVSPSIVTNGAIRLNFFDTNGVLVASNTLTVVGRTPRVAVHGGSHLLVWIETNGLSSLLRGALYSNGLLGITADIATNVANESVALSGTQSPFIVTWESEESNSVIYARALNADGSPAADAFPVAPSDCPQRFPSIDTDGVNHLVCWMEQDVTNSDWRVVARVISNAQPAGLAVSVSQTNSLTPHPTACSFGTNYLVAWSMAEGPYSMNDFGICSSCPTNLWFAMVHGRMITRAGNVSGHPFPIIRARGANTNIAVAFNGESYLVTAVTGSSLPLRFKSALMQSLAPDGARVQSPFGVWWISWNLQRLAAGKGRFCLLEYYGDAVFSDYEVRTAILAPQFERAPQITDLKRTTNGSISAGSSAGPFRFAEYTTNLVDWTPFWLPDLPTLTNHPRLFVRLADHQWRCVENLRAVRAAKEQWALESRRVDYDVPAHSDLFGPGRYLLEKPICPNQGTYELQRVDAKPTCTIINHTL